MNYPSCFCGSSERCPSQAATARISDSRKNSSSWAQFKDPVDWLGQCTSQAGLNSIMREKYLSSPGMDDYWNFRMGFCSSLALPSGVSSRRKCFGWQMRLVASPGIWTILWHPFWVRSLLIFEESVSVLRNLWCLHVWDIHQIIWLGFLLTQQVGFSKNGILFSD